MIHTDTLFVYHLSKQAMCVHPCCKRWCPGKQSVKHIMSSCPDDDDHDDHDAVLLVKHVLKSGRH